MLRRLLILALLLLPSLPCRTASGQIHRILPKKAVRETILALEEQWRQAILNGDSATLERLLSDDYVGISASGQVSTKAQQVARIREHKTVLTKLSVSDIKIKLVGQIAIVTSLAEVEGNNESGNITGSLRYTRIYQRLPGNSWKITSFEATRIPGSHALMSSHSSQDAPSAR